MCIRDRVITLTISCSVIITHKKKTANKRHCTQRGTNDVTNFYGQRLVSPSTLASIHLKTPDYCRGRTTVVPNYRGCTVYFLMTRFGTYGPTTWYVKRIEQKQKKLQEGLQCISLHDVRVDVVGVSG